MAWLLPPAFMQWPVQNLWSIVYTVYLQNRAVMLQKRRKKSNIGNTLIVTLYFSEYVDVKESDQKKPLLASIYIYTWLLDVGIERRRSSKKSRLHWLLTLKMTRFQVLQANVSVMLFKITSSIGKSMESIVKRVPTRNNNNLKRCQSTKVSYLQQHSGEKIYISTWNLGVPSKLMIPTLNDLFHIRRKFLLNGVNQLFCNGVYSMPSTRLIYSSIKFIVIHQEPLRLHVQLNICCMKFI